MSLSYKAKKTSVKPYKQHLSRGCGPSSLLIILHTYNPIKFPLTSEMEDEIYNFSKFKDKDTTSIPGLALYALQSGFNVKLYGSYEIPKKPIVMSDTDYNEYVKKYVYFKEEAKKQGLKELLGDFSLDELIEKEIYDNNLAMILIKLDQKAEILHNIVIRGHKSNKILCVDPMRGEYITYGKKDLNNMMTLPFMKIALVVENPNKK